MRKHLVRSICALIVGIGGSAWALPTVSTKHPGQQSPAVATTQDPLQGSHVSEHDAILLTAGRQAAQMADQGKFAALWDGASGVAKKAVTRDAFVHHLTQVRQQLGAIVSRGKGSISRVQYGEGAQVPAGLYVNISFPSHFAKVDQIIRELISFRLDEDKVWRLAGYHLQLPAQQSVARPKP